jgi:hypothetical protein
MPNAPKKSGARPPPPLDGGFPGPEHRQFPRAKMNVLFRLWIGDGGERTFQASLTSSNISVSGVFLESTFFLPMGKELSLSFELDPEEDPVLARGQIVRQETPNSRGEGRSGFALRFTEFFSQSEVTLAKLFLGEKLRDFAESYLSSKRARSLNNELDRCVDALAAWELKKVTSPNDAWDLQAGKPPPAPARNEKRAAVR